jgi:uncharacterized membrane protein
MAIKSHCETVAEREGTMTSEGERLARALGLFGVGLGLTQLLAPRAVSRAIGLKDDDRNRKTMLAFGVREMATGIGLLTRPRPASFAWGRVVGDAMDLAVLAKALTSKGSNRSRAAAATAAVAGVTILDIVVGMRLSRLADGARGIRVRKMITVDNSPQEAYNFWRNLENLPRFMAHLESVRIMDQRRSYWKAKAPLGATVEWVAEITEDRPNQLIAWRSLESSDVPDAGQVRFVPAPDHGGTEVHVELTHAPPGGIIGATIAQLFGEAPSRQVDDDLRRFKEVLQAP